MSSSNCPICKDHGKDYPQEEDKNTEEDQTLADVTGKESDIEIYESESEHEWDSDDPDNLEQPSLKTPTQMNSKTDSLIKDSSEVKNSEAPVENTFKELTVEKNLEDNGVGEHLGNVEGGSEESIVRVARGLPKSTKVKMPSGNEVHITTPSSRGWKCGRKSKLITLHRHGRMGKKEYNIVVEELEKTKMDIPNCANRGGCLKSFKVLKIRKIINGCLWSRYKDRKEEIEREGPANERMLFHGTKDVWNIVGKGFDERFSNPNGVFGAGVYFAEKSSASNEYTFGILGGTGCPVHKDKSCTICIRRMLLCRVTLGKTHDSGTSGKKFAHAPVGFHSVQGKNGPTNYTEFIIYRGEQAYPEYLISYTIKV